jgi:hypothetical protein
LPSPGPFSVVPGCVGSSDWTTQEWERTVRYSRKDAKRKGAVVQMHGGKEFCWEKSNCSAGSGSSEKSVCYNEWQHDLLEKFSIGRRSRRSSKWTTVKDSKLKDAVQAHALPIRFLVSRVNKLLRILSVAMPLQVEEVT